MLIILGIKAVVHNSESGQASAQRGEFYFPAVYFISWAGTTQPCAELNQAFTGLYACIQKNRVKKVQLYHLERCKIKLFFKHLFATVAPSAAQLSSGRAVRGALCPR